MHGACGREPQGDPEPHAPCIGGMAAHRFVAGQAPYAWGVLLVIFLVLPNAMMASILKSGAAYGSLAGMIAIAAAVFARAAITRKRLRTVIATGEQRPAQIVGVERLDVRSG